MKEYNDETLTAVLFHLNSLWGLRIGDFKLVKPEKFKLITKHIDRLPKGIWYY